MLNSHGNWLKPPSSPTMLGTAVAMIVLSSAMSAVLSMIAPSTGPRSDRSPTDARVGAGAVMPGSSVLRVCSGPTTVLRRHSETPMFRCSGAGRSALHVVDGRVAGPPGRLAHVPSLSLAASLTASLTAVPELARERFRARVSGDPTGAPDWVRDIATVGDGPGHYEPDGVVWRVHGDLSTLVGGVGALLGQGAHPSALAGVQRHSDYLRDPWKRLAGTARWLVVSTFGSTELAAREAARVRGLHQVVRGTDAHGRPYAAGDPVLLRWVHLAFTDAFLAAQAAVGRDLTARFGRRWPDTYVREWRSSALALGATDLPATQAELAEAIAAYAPVLEPVPQDLRAFLSAPPGLSGPERAFYAGLAAGAALLVSPTLAPLAGVPGRARRGPRERAQLAVTTAQLRGLQLALGPYSPSETAARYRIGIGAAPPWLG